MDLAIEEGEAYGLVGESGSGKTTLARCLLRLTDATAGRIEVDGRDITQLAGGELRRLRRKLQVVFQDPVGSLDPRSRVADVVAEPLWTHERLRGAAAEARVLALLDDVGLGRRYLDRRAHELSGGQCQRVAIARALALRPRVLVLDEPTSALDVSVQAQILNLLVALRREHGLTYLLISHDLGVVRYLCDRIGVLYLGRLVEEGPAGHALEAPSHPYTRALLSARPSVDMDAAPILMRGDPPSLTAPPPGCSFHPRCWRRAELDDPARCVEEVPMLQPVRSWRDRRVPLHRPRTASPARTQGDPMTRAIGIAAAQVAPVPYDPEATWRKFEHEVRVMAGSIPSMDLYVFPELYLHAVGSWGDTLAGGLRRAGRRADPGPDSPTGCARWPREVGKWLVPGTHLRALRARRPQHGDRHLTPGRDRGALPQAVPVDAARGVRAGRWRSPCSTSPTWAASG